MAEEVNYFSLPDFDDLKPMSGEELIQTGFKNPIPGINKIVRVIDDKIFENEVVISNYTLGRVRPSDMAN